MTTYLNEAERALQYSLDSVHLRVVELGQSGGTESLRQLALDDNILNFMTQQLVIDVARHRRFINRKRLHRSLHPAHTRWHCSH